MTGAFQNIRKVVFVLDKYSDWLEAYSVMKSTEPASVDVLYLPNSRNDSASTHSIFSHFLHSNVKLSLHAFADKNDFFHATREIALTLGDGDMLVAPFIRYTHLWRLTRAVKSSVRTVHISECLPDAFGHIGYRVGFRGLKFKTLLMIPLAKIFSLYYKADICFFPLMPWLKNPFVKLSYEPFVPSLLPKKALLLKSLLEGSPRPLLVGGFGYDHEKMAAELGFKQFVATSKNMEIIVDGVRYPVAERICAEEVLLSGRISEIFSYPSSAIIWANRLFPQMPITCYRSSVLDKIYSPLYSFLAKRKLARLGVKVLEENPKMLTF